jgi:hypothetical protein
MGFPQKAVKRREDPHSFYICLFASSLDIADLRDRELGRHKDFDGASIKTEWKESAHFPNEKRKSCAALSNPNQECQPEYAGEGFCRAPWWRATAIQKSSQVRCARRPAHLNEDWPVNCLFVNVPCNLTEFQEIDLSASITRD